MNNNQLISAAIAASATHGNQAYDKNLYPHNYHHLIECTNGFKAFSNTNFSNNLNASIPKLSQQFSENYSQSSSAALASSIVAAAQTASNHQIKSSIRLCRRRKARTVFSDQQLSGLEKRFESQKYLSTPERVELANSLGLSETQVNWLINRNR